MTRIDQIDFINMDQVWITWMNQILILLGAHLMRWFGYESRSSNILYIFLARFRVCACDQYSDAWSGFQCRRSSWLEEVVNTIASFPDLWSCPSSPEGSWRLHMCSRFSYTFRDSSPDYCHLLFFRVTPRWTYSHVVVIFLKRRWRTAQCGPFTVNGANPLCSRFYLFPPKDCHCIESWHQGS